MSDAPRRFDGHVAIAEWAPRAMVSLRADPGAAKVKAALKAVAGCETPEERRIVEGAKASIAWMAPDELLILGAAGEGAALCDALERRLDGLHHLAADVSGLRIGFTLTGDTVREVLAKLTPADVFALPPGELRRSRLAQVAAAFWLTSGSEAQVIAFRSVADYVFGLLCHAARPGSEVG